jgi:hypothetical protein
LSFRHDAPSSLSAVTGRSLDVDVLVRRSGVPDDAGLQHFK